MKIDDGGQLGVSCRSNKLVRVVFEHSRHLFEQSLHRVIGGQASLRGDRSEVSIETNDDKGVP